MEFSFAFGLTITISLITISLIHFVFTHKPSKDKTKPGLPPGSKGLPWVGESLDFLSCLKAGKPDKFIVDRMSRHSSQVFRTRLLGDTFVVMCGAEASKLLLQRDTRLARSWWPRSIHRLFSSTLQESFKLKNLASMFVKPGGLKNYVRIMDHFARTHLDSYWEGRSQVIVLPLAKRYTFTLACKLFLSIEEPEMIAKLEGPTNALASGILSVPINLPGTPLNHAIRAAEEVKQLLVQIASRRRMQLFGPNQDDHSKMETTPNGDSMYNMEGRDILTHLIKNCYGGRRMTDVEIADRITGILVAAHDTASAVISLTIKYLAHYPQIFDAVFEENAKLAAKKASNDEFLTWDDLQELKYTWNVVREVMRLHPPAQGLFREAVTDFSFAGYRIPKGSKLYLSVNATHKDPATFNQPDKFEPRRFETGEGSAQYTYVPFGGGVNMCPGSNYAQLEILAFLHNAVKRFRWESVHRHEKILAYPMPKPENGLPVRLFPRHL